MKKIGLTLILLALFQSCIPLRIAPKIEDYKITKGSKLKRRLPKRQMFVFKDPKEANHFYDYVNTKFQLNDKQVYDDVPFMVAGKQYFFSVYEVEIKDKMLNFFPFFFDAILNKALNNDDMETYFSNDNNFVLRKGNWYLAIEVYSDFEKDCLSVNSPSRDVVLNYLRFLKNEYLTTHNYNEILFK